MPLIPFLLLARKFLLFVSLAGLSAAVSAQPAQAVVESFSPQGEIPGIQQIAIRFSQDMVKLGEADAKAPVSLTCEGAATSQASSRWVDSRRWVTEFKSVLPAGVRCQARLLEGLMTLAGAVLQQPQQSWAFTTGGPKVNWFYPPEGSRIKEDQVFLLRASAATSPEVLAQHLRCVVGTVEKVVNVNVLPTQEARSVYQSVARQNYGFPDFLVDQTFAVSCAQTLANDTPVKLKWAKEIASLQGIGSQNDQSLGFYLVRLPWLASVSCTQLDVTPACDPRQPINVAFNDELPLEQLKQVLIRDAAGKALPVEAAPSWRDRTRGSVLSTVRQSSAAMLAEGSVLTVSLPENLRDVDGRVLANRGEFPKRFQMAVLPPYAGFTQNTGVLPFVTGKAALWPLAVRRTEKSVPVQIMRLGGENLDNKATGDALAVRAASSASALALWRSVQNWPQDYEKPLRPYPVSRQQQRDWVTTSVQNVANSGGAMEFAALALDEPGLYLAEANSSVFAERLQTSVILHGMEPQRPAQRASLVMLTNLNITTRIGDKGESLVWVTALDSGQPVAGVSVDVLTCKGRVLAQGDTDKNGLFKTSAQLTRLPAADSCVSTQSYGYSWSRASSASIFVVARKGKDLAVLPGNNYGYGNASDSMGHTILDRTLFKAGETVHMQHLVRSRTPTGFSTLPAGTGRVELRFGFDLVATLPLAWGATGQASSQWTVPANAKLGNYSLSVFGPDGSHHQAYLAVQEFRVPVFDASLTGQAVWQGGKQKLPVNMSLAFLAGGAAAGQAVSLSGRYVPDALPPVEGYSFSNLHLPQIQTLPLKSVETRLDDLGKRQMTVSPPEFDRPTTLQAEMKFSDPNGEVQTIAQQFVLWHSDTRLGLRVSFRANPAQNTATAVISGVALDTSNKALARYKLSVFVQVAKRASGFTVDLLGSEQALCTSQTNTEGKAECETGALPALPEPTDYSYGWLFSIRGLDGAGKPLLSNVFVHPWQLRFVEDKGLLALAAKQPLDASQPIQLAVRAPFLPATLLLTTERESVLDSAVYTLTQPLTTLTFALRPEHAPNVQIQGSFVRGLVGLPEPASGNPLPLAASASLPVSITPTVFALDVRLEPEKTVLAPRTSMTVKISAQQRKNGSAAAGAKVTLMAVDEALLALKDNPSWKVLEAMMSRREIRVSGSGLERDLARSLLFGEQPGFWPVDDRGRYIAAPPMPAPVAAMYMRDASAGSEEATSASKTRSQFSTLAFWSTEVTLDANGQASVKVPFNDSLTKWRLVAVVLNGADQFGTGQASVQTTQPVQIFSGLPPVVRSGDRLMQQVTVRNSGTATVALLVKAQLTLKTTPGGTETSSIAAPRQIRLAPGQSLPVSWSLAVPEEVSLLAWKISAAGADGHLLDAIEVEQMVRPALPVTVRQATLLQVKGLTTVPVVMPPGAQPGRGGVGVSLQASLVKAALAEMQQWMADYPYACLEQSSSKAVVAGDKKAWDTLMNVLPTYLDANGLAKYFPESSLTGSEMLSAHLLDVAAAQSWEIPANSRERMLTGLRNIVLGQRPGQDWSPNGTQNASPSVARLLALQATLMEQGALERSGKLPVQPEDPGQLPTMALTDWARALLEQSPQSRSVADLATTAALLRSRYDVQGSRLNWRNEASENWWWFMWNGDVAAARTALVLQKWQALDTNWASDIPLVITGLVGRQKQGRWSTTVANAWASIALRNFAASAEKEAVGGSTQVSLASQPKQLQTLNWPQPAEALLPLANQPGGDSLLITHQGPGAPWANVSIKAAIRLKQAVTSGMQIEKTITAVERKVKGQWSVGDVARIKLSMQSQADLTWVVVNDPVPSGATILGRGLARESALAQTGERGAGYAWPSYVERAADSYRAYYRWVPRGSWSTEYSVRINNAGQFRFPATRVEAMYAPEIFAETPNADWVVNAGAGRP